MIIIIFKLRSQDFQIKRNFSCTIDDIPFISNIDFYFYSSINTSN